MDIIIKNCEECPFANNDNEYGLDDCNLARIIGKDIQIKGWFEQLPRNKRHEECPMDHKTIYELKFL